MQDLAAARAFSMAWRVTGNQSMRLMMRVYALQAAISGKQWLGWKLVEGKSSRKYVNDDAVAHMVRSAGYDPYERKVMCIFRFIRPTFRRYPASHSGRIRPSVPVRSGQPFRWDPANASFRMPALP